MPIENSTFLDLVKQDMTSAVEEWTVAQRCEHDRFCPPRGQEAAGRAATTEHVDGPAYQLCLIPYWGLARNMGIFHIGII